MVCIQIKIDSKGRKRYHIRYRFQGRERMKSMGLANRKFAEREKTRIANCLAIGEDPALHCPIKKSKGETTQTDESKVKTLKEAIETHEKYRCVNGRNQPSTIRSRQGCFKHIPRDLLGKSLEAITRFDLENVLIEYGQTRKPATVNIFNRNLNALFNWIVDTEQLSKSPMKGIIESPVPKKNKRIFNN